MRALTVSLMVVMLASQATAQSRLGGWRTEVRPAPGARATPDPLGAAIARLGPRTSLASETDPTPGQTEGERRFLVLRHAFGAEAIDAPEALTPYVGVGLGSEPDGASGREPAAMALIGASAPAFGGGRLYAEAREVVGLGDDEPSHEIVIGFRRGR